MPEITPGLPAPPGGAPPAPGASAMGAPPIGPATQSQPNAGNLGQAMHDVRNAVKMLEGALSKIPMESPFHEAVFKAAQGLLKHLRPGEGNQGLELQSLLQAAKQQSQSAPMAALLRMGGGGAGGAGMPPSMPMPAGGGAPPAM